MKRNNSFHIQKIIYAVLILVLCSFVCLGQSSSGQVSLLAETDQSVESVVLVKKNSLSSGYAVTPSVQLKKKSVPKALLMSLALPGTGELYAQKGRESLIKGIGFLALEAVGWGLYFHYRSEGKRIENKFEKYANEQWDIDKYLAFIESQIGLPDGDLGRKSTGIDKTKLYSAESQWGTLTGVSTHHLFASGMQQYYEMIYKYPEQFARGWSDAIPPYPLPTDPGLPNFSPTGYNYKTLTPNMKYYRGLRNESNRYFSNSRKLTGMFLANRFLSALDAVWTVKRKNKEIDRIETGLRVEPIMSGTKMVYASAIHFKF